MFRYLALAWDENCLQVTATASRLAAALESRPQWHLCHDRPGLRVFTTSLGAGADAVHRLAAEGVVIGTLFGRQTLGPAAMPPTQWTVENSRAIARSGGHLLLSDVWGRYVAFMHGADDSSWVLCDPSGAVPCFRLCHEGVFIVFSWLEDVLQTWPLISRPEIDWPHVAARLRFGELWASHTCLKGVRRVLPGQVLEFRAGHETSTLVWDSAEVARAAWEPSLQEASDTLRETVRACARAWSTCYDNILLRLSGGVDSAILLGCLCGPRVATQITCLNYHSPGADSDERRYARLAASRAGVELVELTRNPHEPIGWLLEVARTPSPVPYIGRVSSSRADAQLARTKQAQALFTGSGGDQVFYEFPTWWPAADYVHAHGVGSGFARAAMESARLSKLSVWQTARLALRQGPPGPFTWEDQPRELVSGMGANLPTAQHRSLYTHPSVLLAADLPPGKRAQVFQLTYPLSPYDPYQTEAAPDLVNPLLSQPVVELCLRLPTYLLTHGGRGRGLARKAFFGDMPTPIAHRRSKGSIDEHLQTLLLCNLDFARSLLLQGRLVSRGILDLDRLGRALDGSLEGLADHHGEIHGHICLEAWIRCMDPQ